MFSARAIWGVVSALLLSVSLQGAAYAAGIAVTGQSPNTLALAPGQANSVTYSVHRDIPLSLTVAITGATGSAQVLSNGCAGRGSQNCRVVIQYTQPQSYSAWSPTVTLRSSDKEMGSASAQTSIQAASLNRVNIAGSSSMQLDSGKTATLSVSTCVYSNGYVGACLNPVVAWTSSQASVASVNSKGVVTAKSAGTATITASVNGNPGNSVRVTVTGGAVVSVAISGVTSAQVGSTASYTATCKDVNGNPVSCGKITWSLSNNKSSASIGASSGNVTVGNTVGKAVISAKANGITSNSVGLAITPGSLAAMNLSPATVRMKAGGVSAVPFTATCADQYNNKVSCAGLTWLIENANGTDASINASTGRVSPGRVAGNATVSVALAGFSANAQLVIAHGSVASVSVTPTSVSVLAGGSSSTPFTVKCADSYGNTVSCSGLTWSVSNSGAAVSIGSSSGSVTPGNAVGMATVTATVGSAKATATVTVKANSAAIVTTVSGPASAIAGSDAVSYKATCVDSYHNATSCSGLTWSIANLGNANATIDDLGNVTPGNRAGTATVSAALGDKKLASATLTITAGSLAAVSVNPGTASVQAGGSATTPFAATCSDRFGNTVPCSSLVWSLSNAGGAMASIVSSTGSVTPGNTTGSATVTAAVGSISSTATLAITPIPLALQLSAQQQELVSGNGAGISSRCFQNGGNHNSVTCPQFTWTSSNTAVMTVDNNGEVTAIGPGTATINAVSSTDNLNASIKMIVSPLNVPNSLFFSVEQPFFQTAGYATGELAFVNPVGANTLNNIQLNLIGSSFGSVSGIDLTKTTLILANGSVKPYPSSLPCGGSVAGGQTCVFHFVIRAPIALNKLPQGGLMNFTAEDESTRYSIQTDIPISSLAVTIMSPKMVKGLPIQNGKKANYYQYDTYQMAGVHLVTGCDRDSVIKLTNITTGPIDLKSRLQIGVTDEKGKDLTSSVNVINQCGTILNPSVKQGTSLVPADSCGVAINAGSLPVGQEGYVNLIVGVNQNQMTNTVNLTVEAPNKTPPALQPTQVNGEMLQLFQGGVVVRTDQACNRLDFIPYYSGEQYEHHKVWSYSNLNTPILVPGGAKHALGAAHEKNGQLNMLAIVYANSEAQRTKPMPGYSFRTYAAGACDSFLSSAALGSPAYGNWYLPAVTDVKMMTAFFAKNQKFPHPGSANLFWSSTEPVNCGVGNHACADGVDLRGNMQKSQKSSALLPICFRSLTY